MKIRPLAPQLFYANIWTDRNNEVNSRFLQFCERAYKLQSNTISINIFLMGFFNHQ